MSKFIVAFFLLSVFVFTPNSVEARSQKSRKRPVSVVVPVDAYREVVAWFHNEYTQRTSVQWVIRNRNEQCFRPLELRIQTAKSAREKAMREEEDCVQQNEREQKQGMNSPKECRNEFTTLKQTDFDLRQLYEDLSRCVTPTSDPISSETTLWNECAEKHFEIFEGQAKDFEKAIARIESTDKDDAIDLQRSVRRFLLFHIAEKCGDIPKLGLTDRQIGSEQYFPTDLERAVASSREILADIQFHPFGFYLDVAPVHWWTFEDPERPILHHCILRRILMDNVPVFQGCPNRILEQLYHNPHPHTSLPDRV